MPIPVVSVYTVGKVRRTVAVVTMRECQTSVNVNNDQSITDGTVDLIQ